MQKENDSSVSGDEKAPAVTEAPAAETASPEAEKTEDGKGLSRRDALEVAIAATKEKEEAEKPERVVPTDGQKSKPAPKQAKAPQKAEETAAQPKYRPPAEYTREEAEDFLALTSKQQEAALRLHRSRHNKLEEIKREAADLQWAKDIAKQVEPFLKVRGDKEPTHAQILKALKVVNEIDDNPKGALAAILKAKGLAVPRELLEADATTPKVVDEKITPLQSRLEALEKKVAQEDTQKRAGVFSEAFGSFEAEKNAAGAPKYPDINNTESGLRLASNIGSLVGGQSEISKQFIASVRERIPGATWTTLIKEAYRFYGGRVDDSPTPRTQDTQSHIQKSARAAASVPPSGVRSANGSGVKRFATRREALEAAMADLKQE